MRDSLAKMSALNEGLAQDKMELNRALIQVRVRSGDSGPGDCPAPGRLAQGHRMFLWRGLECLQCRRQRPGTAVFASLPEMLRSLLVQRASQVLRALLLNGLGGGGCTRVCQRKGEEPHSLSLTMFRGVSFGQLEEEKASLLTKKQEAELEKASVRDDLVRLAQEKLELDSERRGLGHSLQVVEQSREALEQELLALQEEKGQLQEQLGKVKGSFRGLGQVPPAQSGILLCSARLY